MKINPYFVRLSDAYILGPCVSYEEGQTRVGLSLVAFEIGVAIDSEKVFSFGCSSCSNIGYAVLDELPPGWEKRHRLDHTYYFVCDKCRGQVEVDDDYVVTEENHEQAIDEIIGQLTGKNDNKPHIKALRDYAARLLEESDNWSKVELAAAVCAYDDGIDAGLKMASKQ